MFSDGKIYMPDKTKVIINICNTEVIQITIMKSKKTVKKSVSTRYEEVSWIENEISDRNTEGVLYKCIEKWGKFLKYFFDAATVWAIELLKRWE